MKEVNDWKIGRLDKLNWCLYKKRIPKKGNRIGEIVWDHKLYYPTFVMAANAFLDVLINKKATEDDVKDIKSVINFVEKTKLDIEKHIQHVIKNYCESPQKCPGRVFIRNT